ncbi:MAG: DGQHR domain-containing protein [Clostridia bacterium]|nr:DGQHR domain-containing protein [Clostridia bacterium]
MKRLLLQKITQYGSTCYIGKINPRDLVRVAAKIEMSATQDAQRPLNANRVKSIAKYVGEEKGVLPNTLTIATNDNRFSINKLSGFEDIYYIEFPSEEDEFENYAGTIDVMDGQHRLYSFDSDIRVILDDAVYEIGFTLYIKPTLDERRKIFISCNEKQEKVSGNLLMWFKAKLNMLSNDEKIFYALVSKLNNEYPLKDRIIMSAEKIKNGIKAKELIKILDKTKIQNLMIGGERLTDEQIIKVICTYLSAWEKVVGFSFSSPAKNSGAAVKIAGLRYMIAILPSVWDRAMSLRKPFDEDFVEETIKKLISSYGVVREEFFTCEEHKMYFRERSATEQFAEECVTKIRLMGAEDFNPLS